MPISRRFKCVAFLVERGANRSHCISGGTNLPDRAASYYPACSAFTYQVSHRGPPAFRIKVSIKQHRLSGLRMHIPGTRPHCYTKHQRLFLRNDKSGLGFCSGFVGRSSPAPDKGPQSLSTHVDRPDRHKMISPFDSAAGSLCPPSSTQCPTIGRPREAMRTLVDTVISVQIRTTIPARHRGEILIYFLCSRWFSM